VTRRLTRARTPVATPQWLTWNQRYEYLVSVQWPVNGPLTAVVLVAISKTSRCSRTRPKLPLATLHTERDAWLASTSVPKWLPDGSRLL
jgi:hypothetical protein